MHPFLLVYIVACISPQKEYKKEYVLTFHIPRLIPTYTLTYTDLCTQDP